MTNSEINALMGKKPVDASYSSEPSLATPAHTSNQFYGRPLNSFVGQMPPPSLVYTAPVGSVLATGQTDQTDQALGQTGAMLVTPRSPTLLRQSLH